jgi:hypothetical protein
MTKRSSGKFKRNKGDFYVTPPSAVVPLIPHLPPGVTFDEPCAGDGALVDALEQYDTMCVSMSDIDPKRNDIEQCDAFDINSTLADCFITNPPWTREWLHPMIIHLSNIAPTFMLYDADWFHTRQASEFSERCSDIISVGRASWMGNGISGFDNASWYRFTVPVPGRHTKLHWRT